MANPWSPVHWSGRNGVHADRIIDGQTYHLPYSGQTTLDTFTNPSYRNDLKLRSLGGDPPSLRHGKFGTMFSR